MFRFFNEKGILLHFSEKNVTDSNLRKKVIYNKPCSVLFSDFVTLELGKTLTV